METSLEVLFTPAEFEALKQRDLRETVCVVFDVLRATSSMVVALANDAEAIVPVVEIAEALRIRERQPDVLLAGERDGVRIRGHLTGGIDFDLGNSPREFTREKVRGRTVVMTTTNGTRALRACATAGGTLICSLFNLGATAEFIARKTPARLLLVCSGTFDQAAYEDVLGAGGLCDLLWPEYATGMVADSALMCRDLFGLAKTRLLGAASESRNAKRLLARPELAEDVRFSLQHNLFGLAAGQAKDGSIRRLI
jgi:2-phosphosulfolactate phosphatase